MVVSPAVNRLLLTFSLITILGGTAFFAGRSLRNPQRGPRDGNWERIQAQKYIVIGVDPSIPPFGEHTPTGAIGLDPSLGKALADRLGLEPRFVLLSFDGLYDALLLGSVDIVIAALRPDALRMDRVRYTTPYFDAGQVLVSREPLSRFEDIIGKTVAVEFASEGDLAARQVPQVSLVRYFTAQEAIAAIQSHSAQAALVDRVAAALTAPQGLIISPESLLPDPYVIAVRRTDWRLYQAIEKTLLELHQDGTLSQLIQQWLSPQ